MKTFYFHPTVTLKKGNKIVKRRATVAAILSPSDQSEEAAIGGPSTSTKVNTYSFRFGLSVCSQKDQFRKKYGREAALGKAWSKHPSDVQGPIDADMLQKELNKLFVAGAVAVLQSNGYTVIPKEKKTPVKELTVKLPDEERLRAQA